MQGDNGEFLLDLERRLLDAGVRHDPAQVAALLHEDFREFGSSGRVFNRDAILAELREEGTVRLSLREFEARALGTDLYLVTYRSRREADGAVREALRSSVWVRDAAGQWKMLFHQGTVVPPVLEETGGGNPP